MELALGAIEQGKVTAPEDSTGELHPRMYYGLHGGVRFDPGNCLITTKCVHLHNYPLERSSFSGCFL